MSDVDEWGSRVPGRDPDWPPLEPRDPEEGRASARWHKWAAGRWSASGRHDLAAQESALADTILAEVDAIEAGDEEAWRDALAAYVRAWWP